MQALGTVPGIPRGGPSQGSALSGCPGGGAWSTASVTLGVKALADSVFCGGRAAFPWLPHAGRGSAVCTWKQPRFVRERGF